MDDEATGWKRWRELTTILLEMLSTINGILTQLPIPISLTVPVSEEEMVLPRLNDIIRAITLIEEMPALPEMPRGLLRTAILSWLTAFQLSKIFRYDDNRDSWNLDAMEVAIAQMIAALEVADSILDE